MLKENIKNYVLLYNPSNERFWNWVKVMFNKKVYISATLEDSTKKCFLVE